MLQSVVPDLYPDSDGQPMADNTEQYQWIVRLVSNLQVLLQDQTAFVAGDLLWYGVPLPPSALSSLTEIIRYIEQELDQTKATEAEVTFGIQIEANGGIIVSQGQSDANFTFKLRWDRHS